MNTSLTIDSILKSEVHLKPFKHWITNDLFDKEVLRELSKIKVPHTEFDFEDGKRIANSTSRIYLNPATRIRYQIFDKIASFFESPSTIKTISNQYSVELKKCKCRIEYCVDKNGFWLEPHTDLTVKKITIIIYFDTHVNSIEYGTDLYGTNKIDAKRISYIPNTALVFIPAQNTWHGFSKREILGTRKVLIVNYVSAEWRDDFQLTN